MIFVTLVQYNVDSSNDLSYNGHFAYDGSPVVDSPNLT